MHSQKLFLIPAIILFTFVNIYSQTEKGRFNISGRSSLDFSFFEESTKQANNTEINDNDQFSMDFMPQLGYFAMDNLLVGLSAPLSYSSVKLQKNSDKQSTFIYAIAPTIRYYFGNNRLKPFLQVAYGLGQKIVKEDQGYSYYKIPVVNIQYPYGYGGYSPYGYGSGYAYDYGNEEFMLTEKQDIDLYEFTAGIALFIAQNISVDLEISYSEIQIDNGLSNKGFSTFFSFNFLFGGENKQENLRLQM